MICDWFPQFLVISAKTDKFLVKRRFKQDNTFSWKGIARSFFNPLSYLSLFFFLSMIEAVQPSTSMQERKAYPWGCPYHSCRGPFQRGLPPHRSFSGPHRGFSHGPSYRPPLRPPVRRNIATNPYVKPRSRPHRNDNRNFNDFTPPFLLLSYLAPTPFSPTATTAVKLPTILASVRVFFYLCGLPILKLTGKGWVEPNVWCVLQIPVCWHRGRLDTCFIPAFISIKMSTH